MPRKKAEPTNPALLETTSLYGGEVELVFDPVKHQYSVNGEVVSGVTTVLRVISKPALVFWSAKMASEYVDRNLKPGQILDEVQIKNLVAGCKDAHRVRMQDSADIGTLAHQWFEDYVKGKKPPTPINEDLLQITDAFLRFFDEYDVEPLRAERKLYSREMKVAGTTDLIAMFQGGLAILDYKTGSDIYSDSFLQLGAYSAMYAEETGNQAEVTAIVNVNKKGELNVGICEKVAHCEQAFRDALSLSRALAQVEQERKQMIRRVA